MSPCWRKGNSSHAHIALLAEREQQVRDLEALYHDHVALLAEREQQVRDLDAFYHDHVALLAEKEQQIHAHIALLAEKEQQVRDHVALLAEKEQQIQALIMRAAQYEAREAAQHQELQAQAVRLDRLIATVADQDRLLIEAHNATMALQAQLDRCEQTPGVRALLRLRAKVSP